MSDRESKNDIKLLEEYAKVLDIDAIISKIDLEGKITYVNNMFCKISGYSEDELLGKKQNIIRHPDINSEICESLWDSISSKNSWKGKLKNISKDTSSYYVASTVIPILDSEDIVEYILIDQNVTKLEELSDSSQRYAKEQIDDTINKSLNNIDILTTYLDEIPNPTIIYNKSNVQYANSKFLNLINKEKSEILGSKFILESLFYPKDSYVTSLGDIDPDSNSNKVSLIMKNGRNIFNIFVNNIVCEDGEPLTIYTFNNITSLEYKKFRISYLSELFEEYVKEIQTLQYEDNNTAESKKVLNSKEKEVLKKSRDGITISSAEYSSEIDTYALEKIEDLSDLETEISELITLLNDENDFNLLNEISLKILSYASIISFLIEFEDLSYAMQSLGELLKTIEEDDIDEAKHKKINLYLSNILQDLSNWRHTVFIDQSTNDIHYLDSSLFSAILQFELIFDKADVIEDEDDFEMF